MNVLFIINPLEGNKEAWKISLGVCYLSSSLKKFDHQTKLFLVTQNFKAYGQLDLVIADFKPGVVLLSALSNQMNLFKDIANYLFNKYRLPIFLGGVHATLAPEQSLLIEGLRGVCVGEGDYSVVQLVNVIEKGLNIERIPGIWVKKGSKIIKNPPRKLSNINKLPFPDRSLYTDQGFDNDQVPILASRGCPYSCAMCANHAIRAVYKNKGVYRREREVRNVISEAEYIQKEYKPKVIFFADENIPFSNSWLKDFSEQYRSRVNIPFKCKLSIRSIKPYRVKLLKKAGCIQIKVGVESGSTKMLNLIHKSIRREDIIRSCKIIKSQGIKLFCYYMIGMPYESEESIKDTINLHKQIRPDIAITSIFFPFPKTELYELCIKEKFINAQNFPYSSGAHVLNLPTITNKRLIFYLRYLAALSEFYPIAPLLCILSKFNIKNERVYRKLSRLRYKLYRMKLKLLYMIYPKYSLEY